VVFGSINGIGNHTPFLSFLLRGRELHLALAQLASAAAILQFDAERGSAFPPRYCLCKLDDGIRNEFAKSPDPFSPSSLLWFDLN
jgi:hypothetical protein